MALVGLLFISHLTSALATASDLHERSFLTWAPPGPGDVRSPCPGLNTLANHGFIPHNGKGMTLDIIINGLGNGMNIDVPFSTFLHSGGVLASPQPLNGTFDLNQLDQHDFPIEHDASLSRGDAYFGNDYSFNQTYFNQLLAHYKGLTNTTIATAAAGKYARYNNSKTINPTFTYGPREFILSYGESALYLSIMGNPTTGIAPVKYVKIFFEQERFPYKEGWRRPTQQTTFTTISNLINELYLASPEPLPQGLQLVLPGAYEDALEGINPVTGILANLTCARAGTC